MLQTVTGKETIEFVNLQPNTTYYVKEVTPPTGYTFEAGKEDYFYPVTTGNTGAPRCASATTPWRHPPGEEGQLGKPGRPAHSGAALRGRYI